jgi:hypothetical protein
MDWKRHENNIYDKITHWFKVIGKVLQDPAILPENVYNMDETGVMLCMLGSIKVLVGKDGTYSCGVGVTRFKRFRCCFKCLSVPSLCWQVMVAKKSWTYT